MEKLPEFCRILVENVVAKVTKYICVLNFK